MALGIGEGSELQAPLARVVIGGLATSTLITLIVIPIVYAMLEERTERARAAAPERTQALQPAESAGD
jgi:HAE1 family hydrophobic/amphiphilic exporter-1